MKPIESIEKEHIAHLFFSKKEVLPDPDLQKLRLSKLFRSQTLGNLLQTKVYLTFEAADGNIYQTHTTVWAVGNDYISLKGGLTIPVSSILEVD
ncbi:hypothetical protein JYB62_17825 [Algoriphagus lutimaris]|uniref:Uncharacterized protein n=1 Tax=Algoriphagus halophilus TaxID=226505 RepID=A0A1N6HC63_9BACT|nr:MULTISPECIES: hypothetical protein [Algoriphagus]MBN3521870.1 hypothetical protein [Algoriphagus lutimaris]SIO17360.1 hypothetical protein SAMN05444394_3728 [Algoriphagus halophilus]